MFGRSSLVVLWILLVASAAASRPAQGQTTALWMDSQAGDWVGGGKLWSYTPVDATFTASPGTTVSISVVASGESFVRWSLNFRAAGATRPVVGVYESARRAPFTKFVGLDVGETVAAAMSSRAASSSWKRSMAVTAVSFASPRISSSIVRTPMQGCSVPFGITPRSRA